MRCPSCGTENEPDSRFCGGCGARLTPALPPTQKIDTGAQPVQSAAHVVGQRTPSQEPASRQVSGQQNVPPASYPLTPSVQRNPSKPLAVEPLPTPARGSKVNGAAPAAAQSVQRPSQQQRSESSAAVPKRRVGLIIAVLLVDAALAAAGGWMLSEGLASTPATPSASPAPAPTSASPKPDSAKPGSATAPAAGSAGSGSAAKGSSAAVAPAPPDAGTAVANAGSAAPIETPPDAGAGSQTAQVDPKPVKVKKATQSRTKKQRKTKNGPVDPYDEGPNDPFPPDLTPPPPPPPSPFPP